MPKLQIKLTSFQPKGYLSNWEAFKLFLWNVLENKQRKLRIQVPGYPVGNG